MSDQDHTAQAYCADQARTHDFTAYAASLFVPPEPRRAWLALAAFNADVAHIRDHISQPMPGEIRLQWWRDTLTGTGEGEQGNPVAAELLRVVKRYDLPVGTLVRLIDAHVFDVYDDPMPDMAALEAHCRDTSAALYELRAKILGASSPEIGRLAEHAGIADGIVQVMLALPRHAARRQLYLPADLMNLHGVVAEEIFLRQSSPAIEGVLTHLRREARSQLDQALAMLNATPQSVRTAFLPLSQVGRTLKRLEKADPFAPPQPSRFGTLWTMWRAANSKPFKAKP